MKKIILGVFLIFAVALLNAQNIQVTSFLGTPVDTILQRHLQGDGVLISGFGHDVFDPSQTGKFNNVTGNVTYPQIGRFKRNGATFPFDSGLVMTTGNVSLAVGPNSQSSASSAVSNYYTESALSSLASGSINGSASLEFDFIAMADTFAFNYIFASEEYPEFACSSFNDVFAFFLTGIDPVTFINTTKNVAIVPNTITASNPNGIPVAINSINSGPGTSGSSGNCIPPGSSAPYSQYYVNNPSGSSGIQYDGRTTALSAQSVIFSCQTYHMKLCLANVGDNAYDSGVFIEEGSFYSPHVRVDEAWETPEGGDTLVQNCRNVDLTFTVDRPALTATTSIVIETSGDAVLGVDYTLIKDNGDTMNLMDNSFFFPAGDTVQLVHVRMLPTAQFADPDQVKEEFIKVMEIIEIIFKALSFENFEAQISLRDPNDKTKYVGSDENWAKAEAAIVEACKEKNLPAKVEYGEAAFYGPKLDFMVKHAIGRRWQLGTIQVDYNLPERFELEYIGSDNQKHRPVMIHRAPFGSMERFCAVLIEHTGGKFPLWLTPEQFIILPDLELLKARIRQRICSHLPFSDPPFISFLFTARHPSGLRPAVA